MVHLHHDTHTGTVISARRRQCEGRLKECSMWKTVMVYLVWHCVCWAAWSIVIFPKIVNRTSMPPQPRSASGARNLLRLDTSAGSDPPLKASHPHPKTWPIDTEKKGVRHSGTTREDGPAIGQGCSRVCGYVSVWWWICLCESVVVCYLWGGLVHAPSGTPPHPDQHPTMHTKATDQDISPLPRIPTSMSSYPRPPPHMWT